MAQKRTKPFLTLAAVISADGKITRGSETNVSRWTSTEDKKHFKALVEKSDVIVMGRRTFEAARGGMKLSPKHLRVVLTRNPRTQKQKAVPGALEFGNFAPKVLFKRLSRRGKNKILIAGGEEVNTAFLKARLVNRLFLTIEPLIFGRGKNFVSPKTKIKANLKLISAKRLNKKGTLLLEYKRA